jgi:hypothetical protein
MLLQREGFQNVFSYVQIRGSSQFHERAGGGYDRLTILIVQFHYFGANRGIA